MPVYVYHCDNCGVQFEKQQKFSDPPLKRCPECGKKTLRKIYSPVGIVFKGSGFYATDHRSPSGANKHAHKTNNQDSTKDTSSTTKKETKSEKSTTKTKT